MISKILLLTMLACTTHQALAKELINQQGDEPLIVLEKIGEGEQVLETLNTTRSRLKQNLKEILGATKSNTPASAGVN